MCIAGMAADTTVSTFWMNSRSFHWITLYVQFIFSPFLAVERRNHTLEENCQLYPWRIFKEETLCLWGCGCDSEGEQVRNSSLGTKQDQQPTQATGAWTHYLWSRRHNSELVPRGKMNVSKKTEGQGLGENTAEVFGVLPNPVPIC